MPTPELHLDRNHLTCGDCKHCDTVNRALHYCMDPERKQSCRTFPGFRACGNFKPRKPQ